MTYDIKIFWEDTHYNFVMNKDARQKNWDKLCQESVDMFGIPSPDGDFDLTVDVDSMTFKFKQERDALAFKLKFL